MELMQLMEDWSGYVSVANRHTDAERAALVNLLSNTGNIPDHLHEYRIKEAMTTSDFPTLFGDVLGRELLAAYKGTVANWQKYTKVSKVRDFRVNYRFRMTGGDQALAKVAEKGEYLASSRSSTKYEIFVEKYGNQFDVSYEAIINDDLGALGDTPKRMALAADRTEQRTIISLYAGDVGTHATGELYENTVNASVNPLTIEFLEEALELMAGITDGTEPILNRMKYLVVPPALEMTARQILTSVTKMWIQEPIANVPAAISMHAWPTTNVVSQVGIELVVEEYLPILNTTDANTQWYLFSKPSDLCVLEAVRMTGHENPEVCMKASDKVTLGGGALSPFSGDFATDNIFYRVRLIFGGAKEDWRGTYAGGVAASIAALG